MFIRNSKGFTLIEMLVAILVLMSMTAMAHKLIVVYTVETKDQLEDTVDVLQVDAYHKLIIKDLRHAKDVVEGRGEEGNIVLEYGTSGKNKVITYEKVDEENYIVSYEEVDDDGETLLKKEGWLRVQVDKDEVPIKYEVSEECNEPEECNEAQKVLTLNHYMGGVKYDYAINLRREQGE